VAPDRPKARRAPALRESGASRAIEVIGDAWVLRLLRSAFRGQRHFAGFLRELGVSRAVLVDRLARMVGDELLDRRTGGPNGPSGPSLGASLSIEYQLTPRALDLWPLLLAMWQWERHWGTGLDPDARPEDRPRARLVHRGCGQAMEPLCVCALCQQAVSPFDTEAVEPPGCEAGAQRETSSRAPIDASLGEGPGADLDAGVDLQAGAMPTATALPPRKRYRKSHGTDRSALPTLMRAYGDRWNSALLASALQGARTFSDFQRLTAIGTTQLADRLVELQAMGLLRPRPYAGSRQTYHLTRRAIATYPITLEMMRWGDRWLWQGHSPLPVRHKPCGAILHTRWRCGHCRLALERTDLRFQGEGEP
jgi:DNA-binding HxlR family transcriptional regulator